MYCMYCGHEISADAKFCPMCGRRQERPAGAAQATVASDAARSSATTRRQAVSQRPAGTVVVRSAPAEGGRDLRRSGDLVASAPEVAETPAVAGSAPALVPAQGLAANQVRASVPSAAPVSAPTEDLASAPAQADAAAQIPAAAQVQASVGAQAPVAAQVQAPTMTQAMPRPSAAAYVPAAVPGRGPSASAAAQPHVGSAYRDASASRAAGAARPRAGAVIAVVLAAFVVLAGGVLVFGHLGSSAESSSPSDVASAQDQGATTTTTSANTIQAEPEPDAKGADAQKEIELDGLTTSGDSITYVNPTFGYTVTLPSSFKAVAASEGGEGASFEDESSGIRVDVSAGRNDSGATVESVLAEYTSAYDVSYQASGSSWLVASWEDGAGDYYAKQYVGANYVTRIQYSTPTASHETGSQLIEDTINDFKPGAV